MWRAKHSLVCLPAHLPVLPAWTSPSSTHTQWLRPCSCRDHGARDDRQKARLMWLVEAMGVDAFRAAIEQRMGQSLRREVRGGIAGGGCTRVTTAVVAACRCRGMW